MANLRSSEKITSDILVVGLQKKNGKVLVATSATGIDIKRLQAHVDDIGAGAKADEVTKIPFGSPKLVVTTGLGDREITPETLRRAAGAASRALAGHKSADFALPTKNSAEFAAVAEGAALGAYTFTEFRGATLKDQKEPIQNITIISKSANKAALSRAEVIARHTHLVRDLVNTPPSHLTPDSFATEMKKVATSLKLKTEILTHTQLKAKGYGGLVGVGQGSANPPRLLHVSYSPSKPKARVALVGKGITFDSGGLALKPAAGMEEMKSDMSGAAAIIGTIFAAAQLKLPVAIEAYACLAENMPSDTATRPSDVITIFGGKTVEVLNPDAEGRLVLADGLVRAGLFLREFVDPSQPWLHLDIAFPAFNPKTPHGYTSVGGTGVALRSLISLLESF